MSTLQFPVEPAHFDGECVRFRAVAGQRDITCGVTIYALKHRCSHLPLEGLLPAEAFLQAYSDGQSEIHKIARAKFDVRSYEPEGDVEIMVHDQDFHDWNQSSQ